VLFIFRLFSPSSLIVKWFHSFLGSEQILPLNYKHPINKSV